MIFFSPLEQFEILPLFFLKVGFLDISLTNQAVILFLIIFFIITFFFSILKPNTSSLYIIPNKWQILVELSYMAVSSLVLTYINGKKGRLFFPLIFTVFLFVASMNLIGLIPYSFTVTSHIVSTLTLSLTIFIGMNIISVRTHKLEFFSLFLPAGSSLALAFLLVPIEMIAYIFKPLSMAIRLFCNMMAGHTLVKVFVGFAWSLMSCSGVLFLLHYIPLIVLVLLFGLELGVAIIQALVISLLLCIYLNDALNLH